MENRETEKKVLNENEMEQAAGGFEYEGILEWLKGVQYHLPDLRKRGRGFNNEKVCHRPAHLLHMRKMRSKVLLYYGLEQKSESG